MNYDFWGKGMLAKNAIAKKIFFFAKVTVKIIFRSFFGVVLWQIDILYGPRGRFLLFCAVFRLMAF